MPQANLICESENGNGAEEFKFEPESLSNDTTPEKTEEPRKSEVRTLAKHAMFP